MTAAVVPLAAALNADSVVTTVGVAVPPPAVPPFIDAQPIGLGVAATNAGTVHDVTAALVCDHSSPWPICSVQPTAIRADAVKILCRMERGVNNDRGSMGGAPERRALGGGGVSLVSRKRTDGSYCLFTTC